MRSLRAGEKYGTFPSAGTHAEEGPRTKNSKVLRSTSGPSVGEAALEAMLARACALDATDGVPGGPDAVEAAVCAGPGGDQADAQRGGIGGCAEIPQFSGRRPG